MICQNLVTEYCLLIGQYVSRDTTAVLWLINIRLLRQRQEEGWRLLAADIPDYLTKCDEDDMEDDDDFTNVAHTSVSVDNFNNETSAPLLLGDSIDVQLIIIY